MLCVSELSEALEEYRVVGRHLYFDCELADCIIRILDYCYFAGIDIEKAIALKHEYNKGRLHKHSGKKY
jgi:NTP pyrophosphatase (non-canonical NTP hydrolase)